MNDVPPALLKSAFEKLQSEGILQHKDFRTAMEAALRSAFPNSPLFDSSQVSLQSGTDNPGIQNPVPHQEVSGNTPHDTSDTKVGSIAEKQSPIRDPMQPRSPGIPEGTVQAAPELRSVAPNGFEADARSIPEPRMGVLPALSAASGSAKPTSLHTPPKGIAGENSSAGYVRPDNSSAAEMDRQVPRTNNMNPNRNGTPPNRSFKAAPRKSIHLPNK